MIIIRHSIPNKDGKARTCIFDKDMDWLASVVAPCMNGHWIITEDYFSLRTTKEMRASKSQGDEIMIDPDHKIEDSDISNKWLADYNASFEGDIIFHKDNILYLRKIEDIWTELIPVHNKYGRTLGTPDGKPIEDDFWVFNSSYGGQGMKLKMKLGFDGARIMNHIWPDGSRA